MEEISIQGKKLLILAGGANLVTLVRRAQELGVYTIVTDYYDETISPAKKVADEAWNISWSDIDALEAKCREVGVDGITTGYSESPLDCCIQLCKRLGLPCYCTEDQLLFTRDKIRFKEVCRQNGVPVVKEYATIDEVDSFPIIVKPVDRAGSIGVGIATNMEELRRVYDYAMEMSYCKQVIIEKYINGTKIDVYYEIRDGVATLISTDSVINAKNNGMKRVVQSAWYLPSHVHDLIVEKTDAAFKRMLKNLGIRDGYIFVSGFEDHGELMFFESGFRLCGGHLYNYFEELGHVNNMDIFIYHALTGTAKNVMPRYKGNKNLKCMNINLYANKGVIDRIEGMEAVSKMDTCKFSLVTGRPGMECQDDKAILFKLGMFYLCHEDPERLQRDTEKAYSLLNIVDTNGNDMIYDKIDTSVIKNLW